MCQPTNRLEKNSFWASSLAHPSALPCGFLGLFLLSQIGCATVASQKQYPVVIDNTHGATFFSIQDRKNKVVHQGVTPEQVTLSAKSSPFWPAKYSIVFAGHESTTQTHELKAGLDPWVAGNLIFSGGLGAVVDGMSGAMFKLPQRVAGDVPEKFAIKDSGMGNYVAMAAITGKDNPMSEAIVAATPDSSALPVTTATLPESPSQPSVQMASAQTSTPTTSAGASTTETSVTR